MMKKAMWVLGFLAVSLLLSAWDTSPAQDKILPETIWALATYGGTWVTEMKITDMTGGSVVEAYFYYGTNSRHIFTLWTSPAQYAAVRYSNILQTLQSLDPVFDYYGKSGTLWLRTQDVDHKIKVSARIRNSNYGKAYEAINWIDANKLCALQSGDGLQ